MLDGAWVPEDALGSEFTSEGIEYALKNGEMQIAEDAEITLIDRYQELTIQYPEVCTAAVKLSSRQFCRRVKTAWFFRFTMTMETPPN